MLNIMTDVLLLRITEYQFCDDLIRRDSSKCILSYKDALRMKEQAIHRIHRNRKNECFVA